MLNDAKSNINIELNSKYRFQLIFSTRRLITHPMFVDEMWPKEKWRKFESTK